MNAMIRGMRGLLALGALALVGLGLRWATAGSVGSATTRDLTSMAVLTVGAVAWVAYAWLLIAVLATVLEQAPGAIGRAASQVAAQLTSQTSRALLRSALGVAAVTPLTIGVAHAVPTDNSRPDWAPLEPASSLRLTAPTASTNWRATEKPSTVRLTDEPRLTAHANPRTAVPAKPPAQPHTPETATDWRATEKPSSVRLTDEPRLTANTDQRTAVPGKASAQPPISETATDWRATEKPSSVRLTDEPRLPAKAGQRDEVRAESGEQPGPVKPGRVGVPDRPTVGAPTRYTDLRSGHPVRTATRVVQYGDTLWDLAAAELGPDASDAAIAARWPEWYATNRALIGPDPNLLYPGQVLRIPAPGHPVPPTHQEK